MSDPLYDQAPLSRTEYLLKQILDQGGGGGGGGSTGIKFVKVTELPQTGANDTIYLLRSDATEENDIYAEYVYIDGSWERFGRYQDGSDVDFTKLQNKPTDIPKSYIDSLFN